MASEDLFKTDTESEDDTTPDQIEVDGMIYTPKIITSVTEDKNL